MDNEFLSKEPIGKLLFKLSIPTVVAQLINMLYNLVDRIFIGHISEIGDLALTGVGVCLPLIMLVSAFAGLDNTMKLYNTAVNEKYRFFSFGDAMFIE